MSESSISRGGGGSRKFEEAAPDEFDQEEGADSTYDFLEEIRKEKILAARGLESGERMSLAEKKLREQAVGLKEARLMPKVALLADSDKIENQQLDIIFDEGANVFRVFFKLTESQYEKVKNNFKGHAEVSSISYKGADIKAVAGKHAVLSTCLQKQVGELSIKVAVPREWEVVSGYDYDYVNYSEDEKIGTFTRVALGLVEITIPADVAGSPEDVGAKLNDLFAEELDVPQGFVPPDAKAERDYKEARYKWHHKTGEVPEDAGKKMIRKEVLPGYYTFVEEGKYKEYEKDGLGVAVTHSISGNEEKVLPLIFGSGGLMSTHERYRRGLIVCGMSSSEDLKSGGADSVFTRMIVVSGDRASGASYRGNQIVFKKRVLDRTDWYSYDSDQYGSTGKNSFQNRLSPEELISTVSGARYGECDANEQMFRAGIGIEDFAGISFNSFNSVDDAYNVLMALARSGIKEINGRPVEEFIFLTTKAKDIVDIAGGETEGLLTLEKEKIYAIAGRYIEMFSEWVSLNVVIKYFDEVDNYTYGLKAYLDEFPHPSFLSNEQIRSVLPILKQILRLIEDLEANPPEGFGSIKERRGEVARRLGGGKEKIKNLILEYEKSASKLEAQSNINPKKATA